ncbi:cytochrome c oxidase subunit II [Chelativorans sp. AA-79]|uniref:cytochrome c oxidase subunit II n=1 Tax=Chelativorans sp. AA-79 TaxID=3028735 RepID=UPI0023F6C28B|nr:cytochrome c oxidase subunit II [Chelativorans sp. AA-79]WEX10570.1 cytochrome c oxidase subunit II [Chelativorans sp. AA-79]
MNGFLRLWPAEASAHSGNVDLLVMGISALSLLLSAPVFVLLVVFAVKYRRGKDADRRHPVDRNVWLETSWAAIPFVLLLVFYTWSTWSFFDLQRPPAGALEIDVVAKQWMWKFQHPGGQREINELHVPVGQPVRLTMASQDVIHSLYIPALRLKQDVVPGRYTHMWFTADKPGIYRLTCAEYCGTDHSVMGGRFVVMDARDYERWLEESDVDQPLAEAGAAIFRSRGCSGCHGPAATVHAPPLEGLYGGPVPLEGGEIVTADEQYIRDSILLPQSQIAAGYPRIMPTFQNVLSEDEVLKLVAYIKSLASARGEGQP